MSLQFSCHHGKMWTFPYALKMAEGSIAEREEYICGGKSKGTDQCHEVYGEGEKRESG